MIGSGFSKSALKARPDAKALPIWSELTKKMSEKLYPQGVKGSSATENSLKLAQEYTTRFGQSELHRFLQELVQDDDFKPGDKHTQLLKLPWRDIFTTNWDTLLERTNSSVVERAYSVVRNIDEIPLVNRPRIVKLHGSFPSYFPLIFTEEDYQTYPTKFAPFVNTVQQAMMESVFCLIGFSGDDPNFLNWSGWVRDNLGTAAPKIYLAGWLNLSSHRRQEFENRNVVPIDLARHPKAAEWPENLCHDYATEWILHTLEQGQPYDVTNWPSPKKQSPSQILTILEPIEKVQSDAPLKEPDPPSGDSDNIEASVRQLLEVWTHNRKIYPGWLVVPDNTRPLLNWNTHDWEPLILNVLPEFTPLERLNALRELVWRREILLEPISSEIESAAQEVLEMIDCQNRTIEGIADPKVKWAEIREAWRTIAQALVTVARYSLKLEVFNQRIEAVSPFLQDNPDIGHRMRHERCLWAISSMNFEELENLLQGWIVENCDPIWMMRKAALLTESGRGNEAMELAEEALDIIRGIPTDDRSVAGPSREGWALYLMVQVDNMERLWKRWDQLTPLKCNALLERRYISDAIEGNKENKSAPHFDLGMRMDPGYRVSNDEYNRWVSARRAIRLSEVAGLPPSVNHTGVASSILKLAADELSKSEPEMAARLVLRVCRYDKDKTLMRVLSRFRIAALPEKSANELAEICTSMIDHALPHMIGAGKHPMFWIERMRVAIEALSRLVLRLDSERIEPIFEKANELYRNGQIASKPWLTNSIGSLLNRSWEAIPETRKTDRVLDLLSAPIVGVDNFKASQPHYPEPAYLLGDNSTPPRRTGVNEDQWQEIVSMLVRCLHTGGEARERAIVRVASVTFLESLTKTELSQIAQAIWNEEHKGSKDLPAQTRLYDWMFFLIPEPKPGLAEQRFRYKWLTPKHESPEIAQKIEDILCEVGRAISGLKKHGRSLVLSTEERCYLLQLIEQWSDTSVPNHFFSPMQSQLREPTHRALSGLPTIISNIEIPESIGEKLIKKLQKLNESEIPGFKLITGLVKSMPNHISDLALSMKTGLASENENLAENATAGLYDWLTTSADIAAQIHHPPDDLVREIGVMIATRRTKALGHALQVAKWVFDEGSDAQKEIIRDLALQGLVYLAEELRYDRDKNQNEIFDLPLIRWRSAQLAQSMATHGLKDNPIVARWQKIIEEDPLPEVRFLKEPLFTRQPEEGDET